MGQFAHDPDGCHLCHAVIREGSAVHMAFNNKESCPACKYAAAELCTQLRWLMHRRASASALTEPDIILMCRVYEQ